MSIRGENFRVSIKRVLAVACAAFAFTAALSGSASAGPAQVGSFSANGYGTVRLYDDGALAQSGRDGWCYRGQDNPRDWACTAVSVVQNGRKVAPRFYWVNSGRSAFQEDDITNPRVTTRYAYNSPQSGGALYCMPQWIAEGTGYHQSENIYRCGFWERSPNLNGSVWGQWTGR